MLRIGGFGAIIGAALWFIGLAGGSAADDGSDTVWLVVSMLGSVGLLLALTGLSGFQAHREPRLAWAARLYAATAVGLRRASIGPPIITIVFGGCAKPSCAMSATAHSTGTVGWQTEITCRSGESSLIQSRT